MNGYILNKNKALTGQINSQDNVSFVFKANDPCKFHASTIIGKLTTRLECTRKIQHRGMHFDAAYDVWYDISKNGLFIFFR